MKQHYMNIKTGSVDTYENWIADFESQNEVKTLEEWSETLVPV